MTARTCGSCTVCCTLQGIKEGMPDGEPKLPGIRCQYLCGKRKNRTTPCKAYADRPEECASYACMWLVGYGEPKDRPDRLGIMFETHEDQGEVIVIARTTRRGKEKTLRALVHFAHLRRKVLLGVVHPDQVVAHPEQGVDGWQNTVEIEDMRTESVRISSGGFHSWLCRVVGGNPDEEGTIP